MGKIGIFGYWCKVHFKFANKNDHIHFYSYHNTKIKSRIIIGFYLAVLRICAPKFLDDKFDFIEKSFAQLQYPKYFRQRAGKKNLKFANVKNFQNFLNFFNNHSLHRFIILHNKSNTYACMCVYIITNDTTTTSMHGNSTFHHCILIKKFTKKTVLN